MQAEQELVKCALDGCEEFFYRRVHNQKFHSRECTKLYTNARILEQYHERKRFDPKNRTCTSKSCTTVLSVYNTGSKCALCEDKAYKAKLRKWGWHVDAD